MEKAFVAVIVALAIAGCVTTDNPDSAVNSLNASLQSLELNYASLSGEKTSLESQLNETREQAEGLRTEIQAEAAAKNAVEARENATVTALKTILSGDSSNATRLRNEMLVKYIDVDGLACDAYFTTGGFTTGGTITIPAHCRMAIGDFLVAARKYRNAVASGQDPASTALEQLLKQYPA
ncbi:MAG: hypothetical protein AABW54_03765 [Candidatus Micrarchaeota archaeon]